MSIAVVCPTCERKFQAPAEFVGRRVKCKGCGNVFAVSVTEAVDMPDELGDVDPLTELAQSQRGMESPSRSRAGGASPVDKTPSANRDEPAKSLLTPNVLTFDYPGADDVDRWLPYLLIVFCSLLIAYTVSGPEPAWISISRFATVALFYSVLIFPLTLVMVKKAAKESRFALPPQVQLRCFACYMPALLLTTWLLSQANGVFIIQLLGSVLGLGISSAVVWLLFRLRDTDIVTFAMQGAGGFFGGLLGSVLLIIMLNMLVQMMVTDSKAQKSVPASPFSAALSWVAPPHAAAEPDSATVVASTANPSSLNPKPHLPVAGKTDQKVAVSTGSRSSVVDDIIPGNIPGVNDGVIQPLSASPLFAILHNNENGISIDPWNTDDWQKLPGTLPLPAGAAKKFAISTDGQRLAWISEFPRLSVQVWSFAEATVGSSIPLDKSQGTADLIGFVGPDQLLIERGNPKTADTGAVAATDAPADTAVTPDPGGDEPAPNSVFGGFKVNPDQLARQHATASAGIHHLPPAPTANVKAKPATDDYIPAHPMVIINTTAGNTVCNFNLPALVTDFVPSNPSSNTFKGNLHLGSNIAISVTGHRMVAATTTQDIPTLMQFDLQSGKRLNSIKIDEVDPSQSGTMTGLAYSNDGASLATLFEHNETALLLTYDANTGTKQLEHVYPDGPLEGAQHGQTDDGALIWLDPSPLLLLYGQGFISTKTGAHLRSADLGMGNVINQRMLDGHRVLLIVADNGGRKVSVVNLNPAASDTDARP